MKGTRYGNAVRHTRLKDFASALALGVASVSLSMALATPALAQGVITGVVGDDGDQPVVIDQIGVQLTGELAGPLPARVPLR